ncbi:MAG: hypothetical protein ABFD69_16185 [Candidatus Sumerlaeia bacterium]
MNLDELFAKLDSDDAAERRAAAQALAQMGEEGARTLARALQEYPWLPAPRPGETFYSRNAEEPREGPALLRRKSQDVTDALASIGPPAMKMIVMLLRDSRAVTRMNALMTLYTMQWFEIQMAPHAGDAAEALVEWLREADPPTCREILLVFNSFGYKARRVAPALVSLYHSYPPEQMDVRCSIAQALISINPPADAVESVVLDFLERGNEEQTQTILWTMGQRKLDESLVCALPTLERWVRQYAPSGNRIERMKAETAADLIGDIGAPAQETLLRLMDDDNDAIARCVVKALDRFARVNNPEPFYEFLLNRLSRRDPSKNSTLDEDSVFSYAKERFGLPPDIETRWKATRVELDAHYAAMREKNKEPEPSEADLPELLSKLSSPDSWNDEKLAEPIRAIGQIGPKARAAAPLLMRIAQETRNGAVQGTAKAALAEIAWVR